MRAEALLLLVAALLTGSASVTPAPDQGKHLDYTPRVTGSRGADEERPRTVDSSPSSLGGSERLLRRSGQGEDTTVGGPRSQRSGQQNVALIRQAVLEAVDEARGTRARIASALPRLASHEAGIGGANGAFIRYIDYGSRQLPWLHRALVGATTLADAAGVMADTDMALGLLRMTGPRLQSAMFGGMLLAAGLDFLTLADVVLRQYPHYSAERLFMDLGRVQRPPGRRR